VADDGTSLTLRALPQLSSNRTPATVVAALDRFLIIAKLSDMRSFPLTPHPQIL